MAVDRYDATLDDVDALLIWDSRGADNPTPAQIEGWIEEGAAELHGVVGDIAVDGQCGGDAWRRRARTIIALYAAAMAEDAHYPERTMDRRSGDYGARLWARHDARRTSLAVDLEKCRDGIAAGSATGGGSFCFPDPPLFTRLQGG